MAAVFWLTFNVIGAFFQGILESGITALTDAVDQAMQAAQVTAGILPGAALDKTQAAALQQAQRGLYYEADGITLRDGLWDEDAAAAWRSAVMAAYWLVVGADIMQLWWIFVMTLTSGAGPAA